MGNLRQAGKSMRIASPHEWEYRPRVNQGFS